MGTLLVFRKNRFWRIETPSGKFRKLGNPNWRQIDCLGVLDRTAYAVEDRTLFRIDDEGYWQMIGRMYEYPRSTAICGLEGRLYVVSDDSLWRVRPEDGHWERVGRPGDWPGEILLAPAKGNLLIVQSDRLWRVDTETGRWTRLSRHYGWVDTPTMCSYKDRVFAVSHGMVLEVRPEDGKQRLVTESKVRGDAIIAANEDGIFMIHRLELWRTDPDTGEITQLSTGREWDRTHHMVAL